MNEMLHNPVLAESVLPLSSLVPLIGVLLILTSVVMGIRKRKQRRASGQQVTAREQLERMNQDKAMRGDLEQLMVELEELTRRFSAQLDGKARRLEKLIDEAEVKIAQLESHTKSSLGSAAAHDGRTARDVWQRSGGDDGSSGGKQTQAVARPEDELMQQVYELADQGAKPLEIAKKLGEHVGKVELMLSLRRT